MGSRELNLAFETLEPKILLAGNVTVEQTGSGLKITGDEQSNQVAIQRIENAPGSQVLRVTGLGTTVNGAASQDFTVDFPKLKLDFGQGGNDTVQQGSATNMPLTSIKVKFGDGNDVLDIRRASFLTKASVKMGEGQDFLSWGESTRAGGMKLDMAGGDDFVSLDGGSAGKLSIKAGAGGDRVFIRDVSFFGDLKAALGDGGDVFAGNSSTFPATFAVAVDGGDEEDSASGLGNNFGAVPVVKNVEFASGQWT